MEGNFDEAKVLNKIFLIGNGYDLSRGMKTGYMDFMGWYLEESLRQALSDYKLYYQDNCFELKVHRKYKNSDRHSEVLEHLIEKIEEKRFKETLSNFAIDEYLGKTFTFYIIPKNKFIRSIMSDCFEAEWNGIESSLYDNIKQLHYFVQNDLVERNGNNVKESNSYRESLNEVKSINLSLDCLKEKLNEYLGSENAKKDKCDFFSDLIELKIPTKNIGPHEVLFLNFNYTNDYWDLFHRLKQRYSEVTISKIQIHGELSENNKMGLDMVFGIGDEQEDLYHEIESLYDDDWLYCMKSFHYFKNESYQELLGFIEKEEYEVFVIGHSCSITDRTLLSMMFEHNHCQKININHYNELSSYLKTTYNIARNYKDKVKMRKVVQPYNYDLKM